MCDYSLAEYKSRLARCGEDLVVHQFPSGTRGLISPNDPALHPASLGDLLPWRWQQLKARLKARGSCPTAVCVPPGAHLGVEERFRGREAGQSVMMDHVSFAAGIHRDALRLADGEMISLQSLWLGMRLSVVALESSAMEIFGSANGKPEAAEDELLRQILA